MIDEAASDDSDCEKLPLIRLRVSWSTGFDCLPWVECLYHIRVAYGTCSWGCIILGAWTWAPATPVHSADHLKENSL